jgi:outer membrane protein assembly factor BamA
VGVQYKKDVDRRGTQFHASDRNFLGTRSIVDYTYANQDDGAAHALGVTRPFYALDTRWAAGARAGTADSVESLYNAGDQVAEYLRSRSDGEVFGGWSPGLVRGWTRRFSLGAAYEDNDYEPKPGAPAPVRLPQDQTFAGPFVRLELIEDGFRKDTNVNQIGRIEDLNMGVVSRLQVGRALTDFGSTSNAWLYKADVANGFDLTANSFLLTNLGVSGRYASSSENVFLGGSARYYHRHGRRVVYYAAVSADVAHDPDNPGPLLIGGDTGLRGYPLRYQAGERRALLTLEARGYTDWYPLRLFRVGGAVFYDVGRAWGGENQNTQNPGWLHDVGFGLRILNARTAFGSVLHADIAFPLNAEGDIKSVQFVLRTKAAL